MMEHNLRFSPSSVHEAGSFKLLELPSDICKLLEDQNSTPKLTIKGQPGEDAVLCTNDKTYTLRSVVLSNSILVVTAPPDTSDSLDFDADSVVIRDQINEILEVTPTVPKLHKLGSLLRGKEYNEDEEDAREEDEDCQKFTYADAKLLIQASDAELDRGLKNRRILNINGELRPIAPQYLGHIIELVLNLLISLSLPHENTSVEKLCSALSDQHEVPRIVSTQILSWFGSINEQAYWKMDIEAIIKEAGLGILRNHKRDPIRIPDLQTAWQAKVGDAFASAVDLKLLAGNYLVSSSPHRSGDTEALLYFPASELPLDPAARFSELFLTRNRWKGDEIAPFLSDIAVDSKERDKLLLKYARAVSSPQGIWYMARTTI
ncbi:Ctf8p and Ctf18p associating protein [Stygiomarasmius scandens]|uniref:Ctf8p and Ctf18p associating protein n=1 Tax=Marasmiellus scandens TaxID=2682957 RepID=A0ABR1K4N8_9AGAR